MAICFLDFSHIERERSLSAPLQRCSFGVEVTVSIGQGAPQLMQQLAEIRSGLCFRRIGIQEKRDVLAGLGSAAMHEKIRQQRLKTIIITS